MATTRPKVSITDLATGETIVREMDDAEFERYEARWAEIDSTENTPKDV